jgi:hypothetical protein
MTHIRLAFAVILLGWVAVSQPHAQVAGGAEIPDTPAGKRAAAFLKAFNSGDQKVMREFHASNASPSVLNKASPDELSKMDSRFYEESGGMEAKKVLESSDYRFSDIRVDGKRIVGHNGGFPGINGQLDMYLDSGYTVAVLSNYDPPAAGQVARKVRQMLPQE